MSVSSVKRPSGPVATPCASERKPKTDVLRVPGQTPHGAHAGARGGLPRPVEDDARRARAACDHEVDGRDRARREGDGERVVAAGRARDAVGEPPGAARDDDHVSGRDVRDLVPAVGLRDGVRSRLVVAVDDVDHHALDRRAVDLRGHAPHDLPRALETELELAPGGEPSRGHERREAGGLDAVLRAPPHRGDAEAPLAVRDRARLHDGHSDRLPADRQDHGAREGLAVLVGDDAALRLLEPRVHDEVELDRGRHDDDLTADEQRARRVRDDAEGPGVESGEREAPVVVEGDRRSFVGDEAGALAPRRDEAAERPAVGVVHAPREVLGAAAPQLDSDDRERPVARNDHPERARAALGRTSHEVVRAGGDVVDHEAPRGVRIDARHRFGREALLGRQARPRAARRPVRVGARVGRPGLEERHARRDARTRPTDLALDAPARGLRGGADDRRTDVRRERRGRRLGRRRFFGADVALEPGTAVAAVEGEPRTAPERRGEQQGTEDDPHPHVGTSGRAAARV